MNERLRAIRKDWGESKRMVATEIYWLLRVAEAAEIVASHPAYARASLIEPTQKLRDILREEAP